jgi:hypothetical protein
MKTTSALKIKKTPELEVHLILKLFENPLLEILQFYNHNQRFFDFSNFFQNHNSRIFDF